MPTLRIRNSGVRKGMFMNRFMGLLVAKGCWRWLQYAGSRRVRKAWLSHSFFGTPLHSHEARHGVRARPSRHGRGVLTLTLNRPAVLNSCNRRMVAELTDAFDGAATDGTVRAVLVTGAGRAFCAGQDLAEAVPVDAPAPDIGDIVEATTVWCWRCGGWRSRSWRP